MIQLIVGMTIAIMAVGFYLFAEHSLRTGEILMWVGIVMLVLIIMVTAIGMDFS